MIAADMDDRQEYGPHSKRAIYIHGDLTAQSWHCVEGGAMGNYVTPLKRGQPTMDEYLISLGDAPLSERIGVVPNRFSVDVIAAIDGRFPIISSCFCAGEIISASEAAPRRPVYYLDHDQFRQCLDVADSQRNLMLCVVHRDEGTGANHGTVTVDFYRR